MGLEGLPRLRLRVSLYPKPVSLYPNPDQAWEDLQSRERKPTPAALDRELREAGCTLPALYLHFAWPTLALALTTQPSP